MSKFFYVFLTCLFAFLFLFVRSSLSQTELTVSIRVGEEATMTFSGKTSPNAQVSFLENNSVLGTTVAESDGSFTKSLLSQTPGIHTYALYTTDTNGKTSSTVNYSVALTVGTETTLSNIILPPTINLSGTEIGKGDTLKFSGLTVTSSTVTLFINGTSHSYSMSKSTTADSSGYWEYNYGTGDLAIGEYNVYAKTSTTDGYQSESSELKNFKIQTATPTTTPGATPTVTPGPTTTTITEVTVTTPTPTPALPLLVSIFDIDKSGKIELTEVFTAVKSWVEEWKEILKGETLKGEALAVFEKKPKKCDINHDNRCNLVDLSVLLYYIGR